MDRLLEVLKAEGHQISEEFRLASAQGEGTPQEIADFREHAVQAFVRRFRPQSQIISKGKITDLDGNQSDSIDCLILNPAHPNLVDSQGKFRLIFSDGCDAAIEVKPDLARSDELERAISQCRSAKRTRRSRPTLLIPSTKPDHLLLHSRYIPFFVFAMKSFSPEDLYRRLTTYYAENAVPVEEQIDGIFLNQAGVIRNVKHVEMNNYGASPPIGKSIGWFFEDWGEATPLGLLLALEYTVPAVAGISESIMRRVLTKMGKTIITRLSINA